MSAGEFEKQKPGSRFVSPRIRKPPVSRRHGQKIKTYANKSN